MATKLRSRGGMTPREKVRLAAMIGLGLVIVLVIVQMFGMFATSAIPAEGATLIDPDETTVLPGYDRGFLASVTDRSTEGDAERLAPVRTLLGLVAEDADIGGLTGRGFPRPTAAALREDPGAHRGEFVKAIGKVTSAPPVEVGPGVHVMRIEVADGAPWTVYSRDPWDRPPGGVVKVLGIFLRVGPVADGEPIEVVAVRLIPSVMPERFQQFDPEWIRLVQEGSDEERENLHTNAVFYALAWAETIGPVGLAERLASGSLRAESLPTSEEFTLHHDTLQGRLFTVRGILRAIRGDHSLPENPSGLESDYLLEIEHDLGGRRGFPVGVLAPRSALPATLDAGERVVAEGVYLKVWTKIDDYGNVKHRPLLIAPRVRRLDAPEPEER